ncbi:iron(3+)-hydroxamate-binding protein FhuD [Pullulanibacillus camelliae]|uniref:Iron(3+)-hydroxamate-binding protein FhuD n=1 Tax=Pullulanibacillus camelliae TaxID=1707096 RepID=A0A8J2VJK8_9BACL|nr:iron-hydroxamate ABC transporter substrate-binding protein [Pullulanibacillus camelliae]GGE26759.1 iron(3+)-hydroxamate-binding protein FhuD [Pullulanibacillus camelliae]
MKASCKYVLPLCLVVLMLALAACGANASNDTAGTAKKEGKKATITYKASNGTVKIPAYPKRIVVTEPDYVGDFLQLGIKPVGVTAATFKNPYFKGKLDGIESIGQTPNTEKILSLNPDLIIALDTDQNVKKYEKIAPTIAIPFGKMPIREELRTFAKLTGREKQANQWIAEWDKKIAKDKPIVQKHLNGKTVSIIQPYAKGMYIFGDNYGRGGDILYRELGLQAPAEAQKNVIDDGPGFASISLEKLPQYAGDYIFTAPWAGDNADPDKIYKSDIWQSLPAVKNQRVFHVDPVSSYFTDPVSLEQQLKFIMNKLTNH